MRKDSIWKKFEKSGSVLDYLEYACTCEDDMRATMNVVRDTENVHDERVMCDTENVHDERVMRGTENVHDVSVTCDTENVHNVSVTRDARKYSCYGITGRWK